MIKQCLQRKNILFIHSSSELYGSDRSLLYLIKNLDKKRYKISVLLPCDGPLVAELKKQNDVDVFIYDVAVLRRKNLSIKGFFKYCVYFIRSLIYIKKIIRQNRVDVVYTNVAVVFPGAVAAKFSKHCKSVWHIREIIKSKSERFLVSTIVNLFSDLIIANSRATGDAISHNSKKLRIVYNAVEIKNYPVVHENKTKIVVGMAGRINRWKGQKLFVDMAEIVHKSNSDVKFLIAGSAYNGEEYLEQDLKKYIEKKGLSRVITLLGQLDDMDSFYRSLDIFVLPSVQPEPFGLVVIEAMEMCLPVIATNHGGPVEIIRDGDDGFLVPYDTPNVMAQRCLQLSENWELRSRIGKNAQIKKRSMFSLKTTVNNIDTILNNI